MGSLAMSDKILDKYFRYLEELDNKAKKRLIARLTRSLKSDSGKKTNLHTFFGAWEDNRDSDAIIDDIRASRVEKKDTGNLE